MFKCEASVCCKSEFRADFRYIRKNGQFWDGCKDELVGVLAQDAPPKVMPCIFLLATSFS